MVASFQKVNNDTFLKVFDSNIQADETKPQNYDILNSEIKLTLDHENYLFDTGVQVFEDLRKKVAIDINIFYRIIILTRLCPITFMEEH